ncbi:hypothetical protein C6N75_02925 [Streptomyces solincola]|uniref:Uncharacterized protein n=1 Tax=Streptomyces solincola TaxID=2100817 RepID=A0A2S9Q1Z9_9ACTN|nr:hypothetical protein C6N75_02925 [Streptomyces solincola]
MGSVYGASGKTTKTKTGAPFGTYGFVCTIVGRSSTSSTAQCNTTLATPPGQITLQSVRPLTTSFQEAITGGTGDYANARGYAHFTVNPDYRSARLRLHLL